jgi:biopolymer transport protein ExbB
MEVSPYGLQSLWAQGDLVTRAVAILLISMSIASWYVILTKALSLLRMRSSAEAARSDFWTAGDLESALGTLGHDNPFSALARAGRTALLHHQQRHGQLHEQLAISDWITLGLRQSIDEAAARLQAGMAVLASVGSTAPFVGLFGTVWGIYHALVSIGTTGQSSIDKVAGPVGEALIMTALGLAVAIPATFGYNALVRGNKSTLARLNKFGFDLHALFVTGARAGEDQVHALPLSGTPSAQENLRKPGMSLRH